MDLVVNSSWKVTTSPSRCLHELLHILKVPKGQGQALLPDVQRTELTMDSVKVWHCGRQVLLDGYHNKYVGRLT